MGTVVYLLCAAAAFSCSFLLLRAYRKVGLRLLFWSSICFGCLALNNLLVAVDLVLLPDVDLFAVRNLSALVGVVTLLYGLIWEAR